jgi:hypothetical protein
MRNYYMVYTGQILVLLKIEEARAESHHAFFLYSINEIRNISKHGHFQRQD